MTPQTQTISSHESALGLPLGLYVHWPFCKAKCPYCDFNSHVSADIDADAFLTAYHTEMAYMAGQLDHQTPLSSIFFGGGTPSLMPAFVVEGVIDKAAEIFGFRPDIEITAEANPTSVEANRMLDFHHAGVNRVSMGVQSLRDQTLAFLGREHSADEAKQALATLRTAFDNMSIDLMYAVPDQTPQDWHDELSAALALGLDHLSLYQLTIEAGTHFYTRQRRGEMMTLDDDHAATLFEITRIVTGEAGLPAYEISNHARPGHECRHNLIYWQSGNWLGIGPGAHSRFTRQHSRIGISTRRSPAGWLDAIAKQGHATDNLVTDKAADWASEMLMMGLRLTSGLSLAPISAACGDYQNWLDVKGLQRCRDAGWLLANDQAGKTQDIGQWHIRASEEGQIRLNHILAELIL
ncbi:radical SAM family heme chaperone HemW [Alphaproteobacteria bacterium]|nr:radical SAM family heme chaperone HemW [Alphaproteobacteria bacterium]